MSLEPSLDLTLPKSKLEIAVCMSNCMYCKKIVLQLYVSRQLQDVRDGGNCDRLGLYIDWHYCQINPNQLGLCINEYIVELIAISLDRVSMDVDDGFDGGFDIGFDGWFDC